LRGAQGHNGEALRRTLPVLALASDATEQGALVVLVRTEDHQGSEAVSRSASPAVAGTGTSSAVSRL